MKILFNFITLFLFIFLPSIARAESTSQILPNLIFDKEIKIENKENLIQGKLILKNNENYNVGNLYFIVEFSKEITNEGTDKISKNIILKNFSIYKKETKDLDFKIEIPPMINEGNYFLRFKVLNNAAIPICETISIFGKIRGQEKYLEMNWKDSKLYKDGKAEDPLAGVNFEPQEIPIISIKAKNPHDFTIRAIPKIKIYKRTDVDAIKPFIEYDDNYIDFNPGFTKIAKIFLKNPNEGESYYTTLTFVDENGNNISGIQEFRFVVKGEDAKILFTKFNNDKKQVAVSLVGPADKTIVNNLTSTIDIFDAKNPQKIIFTNSQKIKDLDQKIKEITFDLKDTDSFGDLEVVVKIKVFNSKNKLLDESSQNFEMKKTIVKDTKTSEKNSTFGDVILYFFFIIIIVVIIMAIIYVRSIRIPGVQSIIVFFALTSFFFGTKNTAFAQQCNQLNPDSNQNVYITPAGFNDNGANGANININDQVQATLFNGAISYTCANNETKIIEPNISCQGALQQTREISESDAKTIQCKCVTAGQGKIVASVRHFLNALDWNCDIPYQFESTVNCQSQQQPQTISPITQQTGWNPPLYFPPEEPPIEGPTSIPENTPIPATPTPTYIPVAFPTNKPGNKTPIKIPVGSTQIWRCLKTANYDGDVLPGGRSDHRLKLTGAGFAENTTPYIVGCVNNSSNIWCTSGDDETDKKLGFGSTNYTNISSTQSSPLPYFLINHKEAQKISREGNLEAIVYSASADTTTHFFYGVTLGDSISGEAKTLQYSALTFDSNLAKCTAVRWDPKGVIYNAKTYQPIENVKISIYDENHKLLMQPGISNTIQTDSTGEFNFYVGKGKYYLKITPPKNYSFYYGKQSNEIEIVEDGENIIEVNIPLIQNN